MDRAIYRIKKWFSHLPEYKCTSIEYDCGIGDICLMVYLNKPIVDPLCQIPEYINQIHIKTIIEELN